MEGIDQNTISSSDTVRSISNSIFGNTVNFAVKIMFIGSNMRITGLFTDELDTSTIIDVTLPAASYSGDYFGFATRSRSRNYGVAGDPRSAPFVVDYQSFNLSRVSEPPGGYQKWAIDSGIGEDALESGDYDGDGVSNFLEFALGGNPNDRFDRGLSPAFSNSGNSSLFIYPKRNDTDELTYTVETSTNLLPDSWSTTRYTIGNTDMGNGDYDFVNVRIDTEVPKLFIRLKIESAPGE